MFGTSIIRRVKREMALRTNQKASLAIHGGAVVSFSFDDFPRSALISAAPIMDKYGIRGTYYASLGRVDQDSTVGRLFNYDDLHTVVSEGHELACHTFSHLSAYYHSADEIARDCVKNRAKMRELFPGTHLLNFSYPFGDVTPAAKRSIGAAYESCRTSTSGINRGVTDLMCLRGSPMYQSAADKRLMSLIDETLKSGGWLIFYTHDVSSFPSPYGCTPEYFKFVLDYVKSSGLEVLTVRDAITRFKGELSQSAALPYGSKGEDANV